MKLKNIIFSLLAATVLAAGCNNDIDGTYEGFSTSVNFINIPQDGGEVTLKVNSTESWKIYDRLFPDWLTDESVTPLTGEPGETVVHIKAPATSSTRSFELCFLIGDQPTVAAMEDALDEVVAEYDQKLYEVLDKGEESAVKKTYDSLKKAAESALNSALVNAKRHYVTVSQTAGKTEPKFNTCEEIIAEGTAGKTYYAKGTVTNISNTEWGNWYLKDESGSIYVYTTLDANGGTQNFLSLGISEGDMVEISGAYNLYDKTHQLKNVTVMKLEKAFIKLDKNETTIANNAKSFDIAFTMSDNAKLTVAIKDNPDWASIGSVYTKDGKTYQTINVEDFLENQKARKASIIFTATMEMEEDDEKVTKIAELGFTVYQEGNKPEIITIDKFAEADLGSWVRIEGVVTGVSYFGTVVENKVADASGKEVSYAVYCPGIDAFSVGETIDVCGNLDKPNGFYQLKNTWSVAIPADSKAVYPEPVKVENVFSAANDGFLKYIKFTGTPTEVLTSGDYKNQVTFTLDGKSIVGEKPSSEFYTNRIAGKNVEISGYAFSLSENELKFVITGLDLAPKAE